MAPEVSSIQCSKENCPEEVKDHYWGKVKADDWFFQMSGESWCPKHIPDWVLKWRERKKAKESG